MIRKALDESRIRVIVVKDRKLVTKVEEDFGLGRGEAEAIVLALAAKAPQWPHRVLLFDTETRVSIDQTFIFGIYRICELVDGNYRCTDEGVFYDGLSKRERKTIRRF